MKNIYVQKSKKILPGQIFIFILILILSCPAGFCNLKTLDDFTEATGRKSQ